MKLLSLKISNFRVIKSAEIDFPDKVIAIVGKNGVGKSSIIEAISWALYGNQAARSSKDEIKSTFATDVENCEVQVKFFINAEQYTVIRRLVGKSRKAEVELFRGDKSESVGVNETKSHVGQLLGLDWKGYLSSFLARQSELNALSDLVPSKRKDHIAGMLGIEKLDKAMQFLKADTKLYKERAQYLEKSLAEKNIVDIQIKELQEKLANIKTHLIPLQNKFAASQSELKLSKTKFETYKTKEINYLKVQTEIKAQQSTLKSLENRNIEIVKEKNSLLEKQKQLQTVQISQEKLKEIPSKLEQEKKQKSNKKYVDELRLQLQALILQIENNSTEYNSLTTQLTTSEEKLQKFPKDLASQLEAQKAVLDEKKSLFTTLKAEIERIQIDIDKLRKQQSQITTLKSDSICDRCHRPLGDDFESIKKHIADEITQLNALLSAKIKTQTSVLQEGKDARATTDRLEQQYQEMLQLIPSIENLRNQIKKMQQDKIGFLDAQNKITLQIKEFGENDFNEKLYESLLKQLEQFEDNRNKITYFQGQLERLPVLESDFARVKRNISKTQKLVDEEIGKANLLKFSEKELETITILFNQTQAQFEEFKTKLTDTQKEYDFTELSLKEKIEKQEIFNRDVKEFEKSKSSHYYGEKLSNLFSLYRHDIIASIRPTLADISSRLFNEMTGNKYNLVELDEKYDLRVMDDGQYYGVERFSGGEKDLANLCLRLAISLSLTESAGLNRSFIILDEVFGSQDNDRKSLIIDALKNLKNRFPQIILITHIEDIKDGVEQIIEVKQNEFNQSEVIIHGS